MIMTSYFCRPEYIFSTYEQLFIEERVLFQYND